jgi:hypothetical protein
MAKIDSGLIKNFGKIKEVYNNLLTENIVKENKEGKSTFSGYLSKLKSNIILKKQFLIYTNIENKVENDRVKAMEFVNENISLISNHSKKDIFDANSKLINNIIFNKGVDYDKSNLHENISKLIFTEKNFDTIDDIIESKNKIVDYIVNNKAKEVNEVFSLPNSTLSSIFIGKFNDKYSILDESERKALLVLIESNDEEKKIMYGELVRECIGLIDNKFIDSDIELKEKLLKVKDKLLNEKIDDAQSISDKLTKVLNLRNTLK